MKKYKRVIGLGLLFALFFALTVVTYATETTKNIATGLVEAKVIVPSDFAYTVLINLNHENGAKYSIKTGVENGYEAKEEVESGTYIVVVQIRDENKACPTCIDENFTVTHPVTLMVVRNRTNLFEARIIAPTKTDSTALVEQEDKEPLVQQEDTVGVVDENNERKSITRRLVEYIEGDNPDAFEKRESFGIRMIKNNAVTLVMLLVLCIISIIVELRRKMYR